MTSKTNVDLASIDLMIAESRIIYEFVKIDPDVLESMVAEIRSLRLTRTTPYFIREELGDYSVEYGCQTPEEIRQFMEKKPKAA